jgi:hypothetical protein
VTSCIVDSAAIYIMVVKFRNTICPPPAQLSLHRRAALSSNSNGTRSIYIIADRTQKAFYIVRCLWLISCSSQFVATFCLADFFFGAQQKVIFWHGRILLLRWYLGLPLMKKRPIFSKVFIFSKIGSKSKFPKLHRLGQSMWYFN